jgi:D-3-phosphoglycerate dehydrogenase
MTHEPVRVLLVENIHPTAHEVFDAAGFRVRALKHSPKQDELIELVREVDVLGIRSKTQISAATLAAAPHLLALGCFCIGTNQVDTAEANRRGVPVFNAPFSTTRSVAELSLSEVVALARQLGDRSREVHEGKWRKVSAGCNEVRGKTLGIIGYGHIGTQVGVLAESFGLRVLYYDIVTKLPIGTVRAVASMAELLRESDFVTLHVPLTPQTENMIGASELAAMKPGAHLLNASRGTVVQIGPLAEAIKSKRLAGAAIDVYPVEPESNSDDFTSELRGLPNVILTPHIGGSTEEAQANIGREVGVALSKFVRSGASTGAVNFPQIELAPAPNTHRLLNVHKNVPGVLRDVARIVSDRSANIHAQMLSTDPSIGYLLMDLDQNVAQDVLHDVAALSTSIRTRVVT